MSNETNTSSSIDSSAPRKSVFGSRKNIGERAGTVQCPNCGHESEYLFIHIGKTIDCKTCGTQIPVGESLLQNNRSTARPTTEPSYRVLIKLKTRFWRSFTICATMLFVAGMLVVGIGFTSMGAAILDQGWQTFESVTTGKGIATDEERAVDTSDVPLEPPDITLEAINQLLEREDKKDALVQAQVWQQLLRDFQTPEIDERLIRLAEIIYQLTGELKPRSAPPPAYIGEFRNALSDLREALKAENLGDAREALERAETLLNAHPDDLSTYGRSFNALKHRFLQLENLVNGKADIRRFLEEAESLISQEKPTEAAESIAKAMFKALRTPMDDAEFDASNQRVKELEKDLRLARGKRAVLEAKQCQRLNDLEARDIQLATAFDLLPDLPGDKVSALFVEARELSKQEIETPVDSELGRRLSYRSAYEDALRYYGRLNALSELADHCVEAHRLLQAATGLGGEDERKLSELVLNPLQFEVGDLLSRPSGSSSVALGLANARIALEKATPWKTTGTWGSINEALRGKSDEVARVAIQRAADIATTDVVAAVRIIEPAITLGNSDTRKRAEGLMSRWQKELADRANLVAQDEAWKQMSSLFQQNKFLELWRALSQFDHDFPNLSDKYSTASIRSAVQPQVEAAVLVLVHQLQRLKNENQWAQFREGAEWLSNAPKSDRYQFEVDELLNELPKLEARANELFGKVQPLARKYKGDEAALIELIDALPKVLAMNPDHKEAEKLLDTVRDEGQKRAQGSLLRARQTGSKNRSIYTKHLLEVIRFDPDGEHGNKARELLKALPPEEP